MTKKVIDRLPDGSASVYGNTITFTFDDGTTEIFDVTKVPAGTVHDLTMHGASQKVGDSYAGAADSNDPLAYAKAAVKETIAQLYNGDWRATVSRPKQTDLAIALSRLTGKTPEEAQAFVDTLDDDAKKAWRAKAKVKATLAVIAAERAAEKAAKLAKAAGEEEAVTI